MQIKLFTRSSTVGTFAAYLPLYLVGCFFVWEDVYNGR